ncbi:MAG: hypothetical protein AB7F50_05515 [Fimbriimonadaceae bacterium]
MQFIIDDFEAGDFQRFYSARGGHGDIITGIDPRHTAGGSRAFSLEIGDNSNNVVFDVNNRDGRLEVAWDWRSINVPNEFILDYGYGQPMDIDLGFMTQIEVDRGSTPDQANAQFYRIFVSDTSGRGAISSMALQRGPNGILFRRQDFSGTADWSHIAHFQFLQNYGSFSSGIRAYRTLEIRAVAEPGMLFALAPAFVLVLRARRRRAKEARG